MRWIHTRDFSIQQQAKCRECGADHYLYIPYCRRCKTPKITDTGEVDLSRAFAHKLAGAVRIAHLTDLHIGSGSNEIRCFRRWLCHLKQAAVDVVVVSGDLVHVPGDRYNLEHARRLLEDCGMAWCVVPGNHDVIQPDGEGAFYDVFGQYPRVEMHAGVEFVLVDSMAGLPVEQRATLEKIVRIGSNCYTEGMLGQVQLSQLADQLGSSGAARARVGVLHHHVSYQAAEAVVAQLPWIREDHVGTMKALFDADAFLSLARAQNIGVMLHGHHHRFQRPGTRRGHILVMNGGSSTLGERVNYVRVIDLLGETRVVHLLGLAN
ncbi:metallophosphoesterase family protein [Bradymonas sediminis]|uniref:Uncharacterized protein n=1 Tax=Bradymonas sediminis TaxID=1548548 RepID=A0A2Z4FHV3_9DELT|nr:metallophosphoesterase [Bradymonas sediminis]AWV88288.1 hypothetical protein DN745_02605 [Bradymonas sediminis]TDP77411.1 calcineurin-like phosphoesterase family protein [Bradymonas sediminis]